MSDYVLCHIQARHAEQRRQVASGLLAEALLLHEDGTFLDMFESIYGPLVVNRRYKLRTSVMLDLWFSVVEWDEWDDE